MVEWTASARRRAACSGTLGAIAVLCASSPDASAHGSVEGRLELSSSFLGWSVLRVASLAPLLGDA